MTHRVHQIIEAVAALVRARVESLGVKCFVHRRRSIAADQDELPAISVDIGAETPDGEDTDYIYSAMRMPITICVSEPSEVEARERLIELRRLVHIALMADYSFGLFFVTACDYAGADDVESNTDGELLLFQQTAPWIVRYSMNVNDPS